MLSGIGKLHAKSGDEPVPVEYFLQITQEAIPGGLMDVSGRISCPGDPEFIRRNVRTRTPFTLELEDGGKIDIFISNSDGSIQPSGGGFY
jgi:hypothetical protein